MIPYVNSAVNFGCVKKGENESIFGNIFGGNYGEFRDGIGILYLTLRACPRTFRISMPKVRMAMIRRYNFES